MEGSNVPRAGQGVRCGRFGCTAGRAGSAVEGSNVPRVGQGVRCGRFERTADRAGSAVEGSNVPRAGRGSAVEGSNVPRAVQGSAVEGSNVPRAGQGVRCGRFDRTAGGAGVRCGRFERTAGRAGSAVEGSNVPRAVQGSAMEGSNVPLAGQGPLQHRESSPNVSLNQQTCPLFCFLAVPLFSEYFLKMALTAGRSPAWTADTSSAGSSVMVAIVVMHSESAFRRSYSIERCGVGSSKLVRSDGGRRRRRTQRSVSSLSQVASICRNRAIL